MSSFSFVMLECVSISKHVWLSPKVWKVANQNIQMPRWQQDWLPQPPCARDFVQVIHNELKWPYQQGVENAQRGQPSHPSVPISQAHVSLVFANSSAKSIFPESDAMTVKHGRGHITLKPVGECSCLTKWNLLAKLRGPTRRHELLRLK